jgi:hypothetical protein
VKNDSIKGAIRDFQRKLDAFKAKIRYQQLLAQFLGVEFESLSGKIGASSSKLESTSSNFESSSENYGATSEQIEASSSLQEVASLIWRLAKEKKIYFGQPNIPNRLARIVLAFGERKELSVPEMRRITGASRNTLVRDIKILKELGWLEFHGSRKNGYFTLIDLGVDVLFRKGGG